MFSFNTNFSFLLHDDSIIIVNHMLPFKSHFAIVSLVLCLFSYQCYGFCHHHLHIRQNANKSSWASSYNSKYILSSRQSFTILNVGDYAAEIENAAGSDITGPIFQAGFFLFVSGIFSSAIVAFIISKSNTWSQLSEEFDIGKQNSLIDIDKAVKAEELKSSDVNKEKTEVDGLDL